VGRIKTDKIGRSRGSKTKTESPTTPPTISISAEPQVEPPTDVEVELHTVEDDKPKTAEDAELTTDDNRETADTQGFDDLRAAWIAATREERRAFIDWLHAEPVDAYAGDTEAQANRYASILSDVRTTFEDYTQ
jgi:hypothetical protein